MPAPSAKPARGAVAKWERARRIFARLIGGQSIRAIAAVERLSVRRVQQIVRQELERRNANPAEDYTLLQIARLERALDLVGGQIDAGNASAAHAFVRILDQLTRLAPDRLWLLPPARRVGGEVDAVADRIVRLDAARETLALRQIETARAPAASKTTRRGRVGAHAAKPNDAQAIENKETGEMADFAPSIISAT
jgi:hypothetical protein